MDRKNKEVEVRLKKINYMLLKLMGEQEEVIRINIRWFAFKLSLHPLLKKRKEKKNDEKEKRDNSPFIIMSNMYYNIWKEGIYLLIIIIAFLNNITTRYKRMRSIFNTHSSFFSFVFIFIFIR